MGRLQIKLRMCAIRLESRWQSKASSCRHTLEDSFREIRLSERVEMDGIVDRTKRMRRYASRYKIEPV